jgi:hypothetical protein
MSDFMTLDVFTEEVQRICNETAGSKAHSITGTWVDRNFVFAADQILAVTAAEFLEEPVLHCEPITLTAGIDVRPGRVSAGDLVLPANLYIYRGLGLNVPHAQLHRYSSYQQFNAAMQSNPVPVGNMLELHVCKQGRILKYHPFQLQGSNLVCEISYLAHADQPSKVGGEVRVPSICIRPIAAYIAGYGKDSEQEPQVAAALQQRAQFEIAQLTVAAINQGYELDEFISDRLKAILGVRPTGT